MSSKKPAFLIIPMFVLITSLFSVFPLHAQTKVFKEVGEDISTEIKAITQDNALVGYLAFTRLEKTDADSFSYRLTIMDENLNDIGAVNFRQGILELQTVSFGQNVLCLGYIQSSLANQRTARSRPDYLLLQFIDLSGKVINTWHTEITLKYGMQIRNIPNGGFAFFYGDEAKQKLALFDLKGNKTHEQDAPTVAEHYYLRAAATEIYLLTKNDIRVPEGGFTLFVYSATDLEAENNFDLRDVNSNWLKVLSFDNDPATGDAFIAGCIINPRREQEFGTAQQFVLGPYIGLFTLDLGNPHKDMHANCSYWSGDNIPAISTFGQFKEKGFYVKYASAFRDYRGNTIFAGTALFGEGFVGSAKYKLADAVFVRQDSIGNLALDNNIPCDESKYFNDGAFLYALDKKDFYKVDNPDTKSNYMIIDDEANIYIYNVNNKKVVRTIPHKDGNTKINVYPAKEGYMMVSEYNRKEKYTRFSIEAL